MYKEEIKDELKKILIESLQLSQTPDEIPNENLIQNYNINSVNALEILVWVESKFEIEIADEDLSANLIDSIDVLSNYIHKLKATVV
ncbi:acyl carrier protein [Cytobacillus kochii]|uniref:acyl carrier protein n=1 Tax=Cytobacillus kochii TaxID=859143 RepID=UPI001CD4019A|nr:acyl carrier protein [Cytobacillus kochii]MCA1028625.1 acyl carrier protein [Cytobacillus kochii]